MMLCACVLCLPQLNTFGFVGFAFNAIMAFRMFPGSHTVRKGVHLFMHTVAFGSSCLAVYLMFKFHNINEIPNMYSTHSVVGMAALVMFGTQWFMGVMGFFMPMTPGWMRFMALPFHKFFGVATMVAVTAAMVLGAMDRQRITWELGGTPDYTMVSDQWANAYAMCVLAAALTTGFVLSQASESMPTLEQAKKEAGGSEMSRAISSNSGRGDYAKLSGYGANAQA